MAQTEIGEVAGSPREREGRLFDTTPQAGTLMPSVIAAANAVRVLDLSHTLQAAMVGEHEAGRGRLAL